MSSSSCCEPKNLCIDPCYAQQKIIYCDPDCDCKYNNHVYKKYCCDRDKCKYDAPDVFYPKQDAVVGVVAQATISDGATGSTLVTNEGSGFLILRKEVCKDRSSFYVVTTASIAMLTPEQVRIPPPPTGMTGFQRMETYYVEIQNVNGCCKNYVYQAQLIGIDGAGNIAILELDLNLPFNKNIECINKKCHPYLDFEYLKPDKCDGYFSCSRYYATGDVAFVMGKGGNDNNTSITEGVISANRYGPDQQYFFEGVVTDSDSTMGDIGAPLLNKRGKVIGVVSGVLDAGVTGATRTLAISEFSALPPVEAFTGGIRCECNSHLQIVPDLLGPFYRYIKGYLGITWHYVSAQDLINVANVQFKEIKGIVVDGVTAASPFFAQFNGVSGSIITGINGCDIGQITPQVTPAAIMSRLTTLDTVNICYRVLADAYAQPACASATVVDFPSDQDNPF